jgi:hypothetical protein
MLNFENFDQIMDKLEADVDLALIKEKYERLRGQRSAATKKYIAKMRETNPEFRDRERARAKKSYELHKEEILEKRRQKGNKSEIDKRYYARLKERMENDPEFREQRLEQQRRRTEIREGLLEAKEIVDSSNVKVDNN